MTKVNRIKRATELPFALKSFIVELANIPTTLLLDLLNQVQCECANLYPNYNSVREWSNKDSVQFKFE